MAYSRIWEYSNKGRSVDLLGVWTSGRIGDGAIVRAGVSFLRKLDEGLLGLSRKMRKLKVRQARMMYCPGDLMLMLFSASMMIVCLSFSIVNLFSFFIHYTE